MLYKYFKTKLEAIEIQLEGNSLNRDLDLQLSTAWKPPTIARLQYQSRHMLVELLWGAQAWANSSGTCGRFSPPFSLCGLFCSFPDTSVGIPDDNGRDSHLKLGFFYGPETRFWNIQITTTEYTFFSFINVAWRYGSQATSKQYFLPTKEQKQKLDKFKIKTFICSLC